MENPPEMLVTRRPKRSTAGNRMEAALAEMALDDTKDVEDDRDFVDDKVEEDIFGSDFESTDEEAEKVVGEAGENEIIDEERKIRKAARSRLDKITAAAHAKHKTTFNPDIQLSSTVQPKPKPKPTQRVSLGVVVDAESGQVVKSRKPSSGVGKKRFSQRRHTIQNTSATVTRLKQSQQKKARTSFLQASQPKKMKIETRRYTQGELIALALDTEEGNIVEHRDYLKNEAEKRKRARVVRTTIEGPLLRWISKKEEVKVAIPPLPTLPVLNYPPSLSLYRGAYGASGHLFSPMAYSYTTGATHYAMNAASSPTQPLAAGTPSASQQPMMTTTQFHAYQRYMDPAYSAFPMWPPALPGQQASYYQTPASTSTTPTSLATSATVPAASGNSVASIVQQQPQQPTSEPETRLESVTKNYVVHELAQQKNTPKPSWTDTMGSMFGDHVKWDEVKVFVGKNRPLSRPRQTCPITGRQAHYLDPRTGVPYADSNAYKVLTQILQHEYVWSPSLGCYISQVDPPSEAMDDGD
ncbi:hypothetical protein BYT27DRAFT_7076800 [Phlegmacium glaucopus]|nr:hypothetical protein BYT27DRAFT_7076800 [Phlegmacium glaucopus]